MARCPAPIYPAFASHARRLELRITKQPSALADRHPRYGYRRGLGPSRAQGWGVNRKWIQRLWRLEGTRFCFGRPGSTVVVPRGPCLPCPVRLAAVLTSSIRVRVTGSDPYGWTRTTMDMDASRSPSEHPVVPAPGASLMVLAARLKPSTCYDLKHSFSIKSDHESWRSTCDPSRREEGPSCTQYLHSRGAHGSVLQSSLACERHGHGGEREPCSRCLDRRLSLGTYGV